MSSGVGFISTRLEGVQTFFRYSTYTVCWPNPWATVTTLLLQTTLLICAALSCCVLHKLPLWLFLVQYVSLVQKLNIQPHTQPEIKKITQRNTACSATWPQRDAKQQLKEQFLSSGTARLSICWFCIKSICWGKSSTRVLKYSKVQYYYSLLCSWVPGCFSLTYNIASGWGFYSSTWPSNLPSIH